MILKFVLKLSSKKILVNFETTNNDVVFVCRFYNFKLGVLGTNFEDVFIVSNILFTDMYFVHLEIGVWTKWKE